MSLWRARLAIRSYAQLPERFRLGERECRVFAAQDDPNGSRQSIVDVLIDPDSIEEAFFLAYDLASDLADRVSFLTFARAEIQVLSVTVPKVAVGERFQIAVNLDPRNRSQVRLDTEDIEELASRPDETTSAALRCFRTGVSGFNPYNSFMDLWTATETIAAEVHARPTNLLPQPVLAATKSTRTRTSPRASNAAVAICKRSWRMETLRWRCTSFKYPPMAREKWKRKQRSRGFPLRIVETIRRTLFSGGAFSTTIFR